MALITLTSFTQFLQDQKIIRLATSILIGKALASLLQVIIQDIIHPYIDASDNMSITFWGTTIYLDQTFDALFMLFLSFLLGYLVFIGHQKFLS